MKNRKYFVFKNYRMNYLFKSRQILIGVKDSLISKIKGIKETSNHDLAEVAKVIVWKEGRKFVVFEAYSLPNNNNLSMDSIEVTAKTILTGDFNAHSQ